MPSDFGKRLLLSVGLLFSALGVNTASAADHAEAPLLIGNPQQDINDIYAFQSPANAQNVVLVMTVNPEAITSNNGQLSPSVSYEFLIDINGDAREDITFVLQASRANGLGQQTVMLQSGRSTLARGRTETNIPVAGGGTLFVGILDDPFFFDSDILNLTPDGMNNFGPAEDITAIVLEIPRRNLRANNIGFWGVTRVGGRQVDRMGRPGIASVLISRGQQRNVFNQGLPENDVRDFQQQMINNLNGLNAAINTTFGDMTPDPDAATLIPLLLPDILTINTADPSGFVPNLNGRGLADDVIDFELDLLTNGAVPSDGVDNDSTFRTTFPYLGLPNNVP